MRRKVNGVGERERKRKVKIKGGNRERWAQKKGGQQKQ